MLVNLLSTIEMYGCTEAEVTEDYSNNLANTFWEMILACNHCLAMVAMKLELVLLATDIKQLVKILLIQYCS